MVQTVKSTQYRYYYCTECNRPSAAVCRLLDPVCDVDVVAQPVEVNQDPGGGQLVGGGLADQAGSIEAVVTTAQYRSV